MKTVDFRLSLVYSTAEERHCNLAESPPFSFHFYVLRRSPVDRMTLSFVLGKCCSVTPSNFVCFMPLQVFPYYDITIIYFSFFLSSSVIILQYRAYTPGTYNPIPVDEMPVEGYRLCFGPEY